MRWRTGRRWAAGLAFAVLALDYTAGVAASADQLPVIVGFEQQNQRHSLREEKRDPRGFWISQVVARIQSRRLDLPKHLPKAVAAEVSFTVGHDGHLLGRELHTSSGNPEVDRIALAMVEHADPFPPMPAVLSDASLSFTLPVRFR